MKNIIVALTLAFVAILTACEGSAPPVEPPPPPAHTYEMGEEKIGYADAIAYCEERGGYLIEIDGVEEFQAFYDVAGEVARPGHRVWTGDEFDFRDGARVVYTLIGDGQLAPTLIGSAAVGYPFCEFEPSEI